MLEVVSKICVKSILLVCHVYREQWSCYDEVLLWMWVLWVRDFAGGCIECKQEWFKKILQNSASEVLQCTTVALLWDKCYFAAPDGQSRGSAMPNTTGTEEGEEGVPTPPRCSNLRLMGHTLSPAKSSYQVVDLHPYTSYWFLLLPHYKGVLGVPSNLQSFTTPQDGECGVPCPDACMLKWKCDLTSHTLALSLVSCF